MTPEDMELFYAILRNQEEYHDDYFKIKRGSDRVIYIEGQKVCIKGKLKKRKICVSNAEYIRLQQSFLDYFNQTSPFPVSPYAAGWMKNIGREQCADRHTDKRYVLEVDISDYFGNVREHHLLRLFEKAQLTEIMGISYRDVITFLTLPVEHNENQRCLPQGFKTSSYLANCVRYDIDMDCARIAEAYDLTFSAYGDNLYFSGELITPEFRQMIFDLLLAYGFPPNYTKSRIMQWWQRQEILGIVVNKKRNISRVYYQNVVNELFRRIRERIPMDPSLRGKIQTFKLCENPRNYNYLLKLHNRLKQELANNGENIPDQVQPG